MFKLAKIKFKPLREGDLYVAKPLCSLEFDNSYNVFLLFSRTSLTTDGCQVENSVKFFADELEVKLQLSLSHKTAMKFTSRKYLDTTPTKVLAQKKERQHQ